MKISSYFCIVIYLIVLTLIKGNYSTSQHLKAKNKTENSSPLVPSQHEESCLTRLDRVESKVELQSNEMAHLKHEHEELKFMFLLLKNERKTKSEGAFREIPKIESTLATLSSEKSFPDVDSQNVVKRPARLLPYRVLIRPRNTTEEEEIEYHDPPTNCQDLRHIGYTLSGFYSVYFLGKIRMIYCNFKQSKGILEKRMGVMDIKSFPINFYVQRISPFNLARSVITYEVELLNEGGAMNMNTGVFRAPVNGVYYFSFRGFQTGATLQSPVFAYLRVNRVIKATSTSVFGGITLSIECTIKLKKGDAVDTKKGPYGTFDDNKSEHLTHFSGSLLEEDIALI